MLHRAYELEYNDTNYLSKPDQRQLDYLHNLRLPSAPAHYKNLKFGQVTGKIGDELIPLTLNVFSEKASCYEYDKVFGFTENAYSGAADGKKISAIWLHTHHSLIPVVMSHIRRLIVQALEGDLTQLASIHWWYLPLSPMNRGSGGLAELLIHTICRYHGITLPGWDKNIMP